MDINIKIRNEDIGFQYKSVKSLLSKFDVIEKNLKQINSLKVKLDFKEGQFHELSEALVWRLMRHYQFLPCKKEVHYPANVKRDLDHSRFLDRLTGKKTKKITDGTTPFDFETFEPFRGRKVDEDSLSVEDVYQKAMRKTLSPDNEFHSEISNNIYEIINNVFDHSELPNEAGIVCITSKTGILSLCAVDMGQGIKKSFMSNPYLGENYTSVSDEDMIQKATGFKMTCNPSSARNPNYQETSNAGIGLYYLKQFVKKHQSGQLVILSNKGYYYIDNNGKEIKRNLNAVSWPGTLVFFRVKLDQKLSSDYIELVQNI